MSRKIKFHAFQVLFRLFVGPKMLFVSLIVFIGLCLPKQVNAQNQTKKESTVPLIFKSVPNNTENELTEPVKNKTFEEDHIYTVVEQMPQFPGGKDSLFNFISKNLRYPNTDADVQGRVICRFIVNTDGSVSNPEVMRSLEPAFDKEAVRVIKSLPKFIPGKQNGVNVSVWYTLPVIFKLENAKIRNTSTTSKTDSTDFIQRADLIDPIEFIEKDGIYENVEVWPRFPGGDYALMSYIIKNVKYPESKKDIRGTVFVHCEITKTGEIGRVEIFKPLDPAFDYEAVKVVKSLPKWTPGKHNGENVNVWYNIPINFMANQEDPNANNFREHTEIYESVKQMPQFPGGEKELLSYISKNLVYPPSAKQKNIQGDVYVRFVVLETGKPDKMEVVRPLSADCDAEAMRIVKSLPNWIPGKLEGKNVNVYYTISVPFKLEK